MLAPAQTPESRLAEHLAVAREEIGSQPFRLARAKLAALWINRLANLCAEFRAMGAIAVALECQAAIKDLDAKAHRWATDRWS